LLLNQTAQQSLPAPHHLASVSLPLLLFRFLLPILPRSQASPPSPKASQLQSLTDRPLTVTSLPTANPDHPHSATHPSASPPTTALDRDIEPIETPSEPTRPKSSLLRSTVRYDDNGTFSLALNTANPSGGTAARRHTTVRCGRHMLTPRQDLRVGNKYRIGRKIGSGSFGDIYLGMLTPLTINKARY
jgi:hypothetical protein